MSIYGAHRSGLYMTVSVKGDLDFNIDVQKPHEGALQSLHYYARTNISLVYRPGPDHFV